MRGNIFNWWGIIARIKKILEYQLGLKILKPSTCFRDPESWGCMNIIPPSIPGTGESCSCSQHKVPSCPSYPRSWGILNTGALKTIWKTPWNIFSYARRPYRRLKACPNELARWSFLFFCHKSWCIPRNRNRICRTMLKLFICKLEP